jgi:hypothetical protein
LTADGAEERRGVADHPTMRSPVRVATLVFAAAALVAFGTLGSPTAPALPTQPAVAAVAQPTQPAAAVAAAPGATNVHGQVVALTATPDGGLLVGALAPIHVGDTGAQAAGGAPVVHRILPDGTAIPGRPAPIQIARARLALIGDHAVLAYDVGDPANRNRYVAARTLTTDGTLSDEDIVSTPGRDASNPGPLTVGPTGATAFTFWQTQGRRTLARLAFRPAAADRFLPPRTLGIAGTDGDARVFLGPDGGGVVVDGLETGAVGPAVKAIRLRRLTPDGRLRPPMLLRLGRRLEAVASGTYAGSTFALALTVNRLGAAALYTTSLAPGATRPSALQRLTPAPEADEDTIKLVGGAAGHVTLLAPHGGKGLQTFTGTPGKLRRDRPIPARDPLFPRAATRHDGTTVAFWLGAITKSTDVRLQLARRSGSGQFGTPSIAPGFPASPDRGYFGGSEDSLTDPVVLADGRIAIAYNPEDGPDATVLAVP